MMKTFAEYLKDFLTIYLPTEVNNSSNTVESYTTTFNLLIRYIVQEKKIPIQQIQFNIITKELIKEFLLYLSNDRKNIASTINQRLAGIKSFYQYIKAENSSILFDTQSILSIKTKKSELKELDYFTRDELKSFFEVIETSSKKGRRNLTLLSLLYDSAARIDELLSLRLYNLDLSTDAKVLITGKGRKQRTVPLMENTKELLFSYINENKIEHGDLLFSNSKGNKICERTIELMIKKYIQKMELKKNITPHSFRRTRAMHLLESGVNIVYIRDLLGHESVVTTERYARANEEIKRKAISAAYPDIITNEITDWNKDENLLKELLKL